MRKNHQNQNQNTKARSIFPRFIFGFLIFALSFNAAAKTEFSSTERKNFLLELYTSEGCSSCPPADAWLAELKNLPQLFTEIVPLAFHVDYWDDLGWRDPYAKAAHSERQRLHRYQGNLSNVYTPGVIANGRELRRWWQGFDLDAGREVVGKINVCADDDKILANFDNLENHQNMILNVAILGSDIVSEVHRGENAGRTLEHNFVVLNHQNYPFNGARLQVPMPKTKNAPRLALAVWVSQKNNLKPIQAAGAWLSENSDICL